MEKKGVFGRQLGDFELFSKSVKPNFAKTNLFTSQNLEKSNLQPSAASQLFTHPPPKPVLARNGKRAKKKSLPRKKHERARERKETERERAREKEGRRERQEESDSKERYRRREKEKERKIERKNPTVT